MLKQIAENIYRKTVPLPHNPLRELNAYIIKGEKSLLIDTGFNRPECEEALQSAFDELGIDAVDLFITHLHSDHCGLVSKFAKEQSRVFASETDGELINFGSGNLYWSMLDELFIKFGFPRADYGHSPRAAILQRGDGEIYHSGRGRRPRIRRLPAGSCCRAGAYAGAHVPV